MENNVKASEKMSMGVSSLLNVIQMGIGHKTWDAGLAYEEIIEQYDHVKNHLKENLGNILDLSNQELRVFGFMRWDEERDLLLIPLWIFDMIPDGTILYSFDGDRVIKGTDKIDMDVRFGCLAYGILKAEEE